MAKKTLWHFRFVCACGGRMYGETDQSPRSLVEVFLSVHDGRNPVEKSKEHWVATALADDKTYKDMPTLARLQREANSGMKAHYRSKAALLAGLT